MENLIYIKDSEGYVKGIYPNEMKPEYTIITREEWAEESGENYYKDILLMEEQELVQAGNLKQELFLNFKSEYLKKKRN